MKLLSCSLCVLLVMLSGFDGKAQSTNNKNLYKTRIIGKWLNVRDDKDVIRITKNHWINYVDGLSDTSIFFFFPCSKDTIGVLSGTDTLVYRIQYVDEQSLELDYLGPGTDKSKWFNTIISYRREW